MAIFQCQIQVIKRSEGRSVVAAAAYRSASKLQNRYTGNVEDYSKKKWLKYSEIIFPENAPKKFQDRETLWNSVEEVEKGSRARLAREIVVALPSELSMEENIRLVQEYVRDAFVSDGMIADINIHNPPVKNEKGIPVDKNDQPVTDEKDMIFRNPHAHILLTVRPLDKNGDWQAKTQKEYVCKRGEEMKAFTAEEFVQAKTEGWEKQYQYYKGHQKIWLTPSEAYMENLVRVSKNPRSTPYGRRNERIEFWNSKDAVFVYRKSWEEHVNKALERAGRQERVDCRSYEERGEDTISEIHLGPHASRRKDSDRYQMNEDIKSLNETNRHIRKILDDLEEQIREKNRAVYEKVAEHLGKLRGEIITARYHLENLEKRRDVLEKEIQPLKDSVVHIRNVQKTIREKDRQAEQKTARLGKELGGEFPVWSSRPAEIQAEIESEQEGIRFREERLVRILAEEGFADIREYEQKAASLAQMEKEAEMLEQKISLYEKKIQDYTERYESLCGRLQEEDIHSSEFKERRERWSSAYEQKASDSIQKHRHFRPEAFRRAVHKTDYALSHAVYLAGRTEYLVSRMQKMADEMSGDDRQRSP